MYFKDLHCEIRCERYKENTKKQQASIARRLRLTLRFLLYCKRRVAKEQVNETAFRFHLNMDKNLKYF
ncbi:hypothetical protein T10_3962 [Trichinella papuae]|uniref:Uncharacterized protein n=1 Tax=Trichinella papuae TaxID=268474 RepID=A0A0V1MIN3_9BILA|nr:hypothetical protein T10_3962 [Trichinella papuae]